MDPVGMRKPLLGEGRSLVGFDDFCLNTGLDRDTAENVIRTKFLAHSFWSKDEPSRLTFIDEAALPSRAELVVMGLPVRDDYDPQNLRHGGIECAAHGWAPSVLLTRYDADHRELPDGYLCWECSQAGVPPDSGNSIPLEPEEVERWRRTHDRDGTWIGPDEDE